MKLLRTFAILFVVQLFNYCLITYNYRAIAQAQVSQALLSDALIASANFFIIKKIAKDEDQSVVPWLGYTLGGVAGTYAGIYLSLGLHWK